uniref:Uncharacterized protein n=2 Tax=Picea TaxID=3328 RepID=A0A101LW09_PICGL|nr:hypothetical protein ABT39_MTgene1493 [Picea glauca]QHR92658.1 hypothetical protein Q903MT_gene6706 [Picea sitchensis]
MEECWFIGRLVNESLALCRMPRKACYLEKKGGACLSLVDRLSFFPEGMKCMSEGRERESKQSIPFISLRNVLPLFA